MLKYADDEKAEKLDIPPRPESPSYYDELARKVSWHHKILLNRPLRFGIVMCVAAVLLPCLAFYFFYQSVYTLAYIDGYSIGTCQYETIHRLPCGVQNQSVRDECPSNCCYDDETDTCYHFVPSRFSFISKNAWTEDTILKPRFQETPYGASESIAGLKLELEELSGTHLRFVLQDASKVESKDRATQSKYNGSLDYRYFVYYPEFYIEIFEINGTKPLISSSRGPLIATEEMMEWSLYFQGNITLGLGNITALEKSTTVIYNSKESHYSEPVFFGHYNESVFLLYFANAEPMEFQLSESKIINIKAFGATKMDFHFFIGKDPDSVLSQFVEFKGKIRDLPVWSLGAHFCRRSTGNFEDDIKAFQNFSSSAFANGLTYESDCIVEDLHWNLEENWQFQNITNNYVKRFTPTISSQLPYDKSDQVFQDALESGILIMEPSGKEPLMRIVDGSLMVYPDYYNSDKVLPWMRRHWRWPDEITSFVLKDNWPSGEEESDCKIDFSYVTKEMKSSLCRGIPWNAINTDTELHFLKHNLYGDAHLQVIENFIANKTDSSSFIWSSNNWRMGTYGKSEQNVKFTWPGMLEAFQKAIAGSLQGNIYQSVPVCGDQDPEMSQLDAEKLCLRWYAASSLFPGFRISTTNGDPFAYSLFGRDFMLKIVNSRYRMLPYLYTVLSQSKPLLRPMFFDFFRDEQVQDLDKQFMIGSALLVAPSFEAMESSVSVYIPEDEEFFEVWGGQEIPREEGGWVQIPSLEMEAPTLLRAGYVIPLQQEVKEDAESTRRQSPFSLFVGLKCVFDELDGNRTCHANGNLYAGDFISFTVTEEEITIDPNFPRTREELCQYKNTNDTIKEVVIYGLEKNRPHKKEINNNLCALQDGELLVVKLP